MGIVQTSEVIREEEEEMQVLGLVSSCRVLHPFSMKVCCNPPISLFYLLLLSAIRNSLDLKCFLHDNNRGAGKRRLQIINRARRGA